MTNKLSDFQQKALDAINIDQSVPVNVAAAYINWADQIVPRANDQDPSVYLERAVAAEYQGNTSNHGFHYRCAVAAELGLDNPDPQNVKEFLEQAATYSGRTHAPDRDSLMTLARGADHLVRLSIIHKEQMGLEETVSSQEKPFYMTNEWMRGCDY